VGEAEPFQRLFSVSTLYFAGEATETTLAATVAGAIKSGRRAAAEIIGRTQH
jgi:monoamine oxidase